MSKIVSISPLGIGGMGDWREEGSEREQGACHDVEGEKGKKARMTTAETGEDVLAVLQRYNIEAITQIPA